jgi:heptosyltransferase-3
MRILFIKLRHIGDSLLLTPTIVATKAKFPNAEIWLLVRKSCDAILAGCPEIDRILTTANPDAAKRGSGDWIADLKLAALLRQTDFDFVFELTDNDRARFFAIAARTKARCTNEHRTLNRLWRPFFHRICNLPRRRQHQVVRDYLCPQETLGLPDEPGALRFAESLSTPWQAHEYDNGVSFAILHIHTRWERKAWPMERWHSLIEHLLRFVPRLLITCGPDAQEVESSNDLCLKFGPRLQTTGGTANWTQIAWLLQKAKFFVGVDTAAMHLASACGCPTIALFGPSPVFEYHPWKVRHWMIRPQEWLSEIEAKKIGPDQIINEIPVEKVLQACQEAFNLS